MKTLGRILIVLLVALIVISAVYALAQTSAVRALVDQPMDSGSPGDRPMPSGFANGQGEPTGELVNRPEGGSEGRDGWQTLAQNLLKMAVVVAVVQVLWSIGRWVQRMSTSFVRKNQLRSGRAS